MLKTALSDILRKHQNWTQCSAQLFLLLSGVLACCASHHLLTVPWDCLVASHQNGSKVLESAGVERGILKHGRRGSLEHVRHESLEHVGHESLEHTGHESLEHVGHESLEHVGQDSLELAGVALVVYGLLQILPSSLCLLLLAIRSNILKKLSLVMVCTTLVQLLACLVVEISLVLLLYSTRSWSRRKSLHCTEVSTDIISWPGALLALLLVSMCVHVLVAAILLPAWIFPVVKVSSPPRVRLESERSGQEPDTRGTTRGPAGLVSLSHVVRSRLPSLWNLHPGQPASPALLNSFDDLAEVPLTPHQPADKACS